MKKWMICSRKPSRHKPSKKPPNLQEPTILKDASLGSRPNTAPKSSPRYNGITRKATKLFTSCTTCSFRPRKKPREPPKRSTRSRTILDRQSPSPLSSLLVLRCSTEAVTSRHCKRVPTALQGTTVETVAAESSPCPSPRLSPRFYLRHTPTLANFKHLDDRRGRADNARPATPSTGS